MGSDSNKRVRRVETLSFDEFQEDFVRTGTPVLMTKMLGHWPALQLWSKDYLRDRVGEAVCPVFTIPAGSHKSRGKEQAYTGSARQNRMSVNEFLDWTDGRPSIDDIDIDRHYLGDVPLEDPACPLAPLMADIGYPDIVDPHLYFAARLFTGFESFGDMHFHSIAESFLAGVVGTKRAVLYPAEHFFDLYPRALWAPGNHFSRIDDFDAPDLERFPRLRNARPVEVTVGPGELLYIPLNWWHAAYGIDYSATLTFFWKASFAHYPDRSLMLRCLAGEGVRRVQDSLSLTRHRARRVVDLLRGN